MLTYPQVPPEVRQQGRRIPLCMYFELTGLHPEAALRLHMFHAVKMEKILGARGIKNMSSPDHWSFCPSSKEIISNAAPEFVPVFEAEFECRGGCSDFGNSGSCLLDAAVFEGVTKDLLDEWVEFNAQFQLSCVFLAAVGLFIGVLFSGKSFARCLSPRQIRLKIKRLSKPYSKLDTDILRHPYTLNKPQWESGYATESFARNYYLHLVFFSFDFCISSLFADKRVSLADTSLGILRFTRGAMFIVRFCARILFDKMHDRTRAQQIGSLVLCYTYLVDLALFLRLFLPPFEGFEHTTLDGEIAVPRGPNWFLWPFWAQNLLVFLQQAVMTPILFALLSPSMWPPFLSLVLGVFVLLHASAIIFSAPIPDSFDNFGNNSGAVEVINLGQFDPQFVFRFSQALWAIGLIVATLLGILISRFMRLSYGHWQLHSNYLTETRLGDSRCNHLLKNKASSVTYLVHAIQRETIPELVYSLTTKEQLKEVNELSEQLNSQTQLVSHMTRICHTREVLCQIASGRYRTLRSRVDVAQVLNSYSASKLLQVTVHCPPLAVDINVFTIIVEEALSNALKYRVPGGAVSMTGDVCRVEDVERFAQERKRRLFRNSSAEPSTGRFFRLQLENLIDPSERKYTVEELNREEEMGKEWRKSSQTGLDMIRSAASAARGTYWYSLQRTMDSASICFKAYLPVDMDVVIPEESGAVIHESDFQLQLPFDNTAPVTAVGKETSTQATSTSFLIQQKVEIPPLLQEQEVTELHGLRVLICNDTAMNMKLVAYYIQEVTKDCEYVHMETPELAVELFRTSRDKPFDIVIMDEDFENSKMLGGEAIKQIRQLEKEWREIDGDVQRTVIIRFSDAATGVPEQDAWLLEESEAVWSKPLAIQVDHAALKNNLCSYIRRGRVEATRLRP